MQSASRFQILKYPLLIFLLSGFALATMPFLKNDDAKQKGCILPKRQAPLASGMFETASFANTEKMLPANNQTIYVMVVPVAFADLGYDISLASLSNLFFGPTNSVSNYYSKVSRGRFRLTGFVTPLQTLTGNKADYGANDSTGEAFALAAAAELSSYLSVNQPTNFVAYSNAWDVNKDGYQDAVIFVHAGSGAEVSGDPDEIHSHSWSFSRSGAYGDGVSISAAADLKLGRYCVTPEIANPNYVLFNDYIKATIGVHCHEFAHILGLCDLYNTSTGETAVGSGDLMDLGSYNNAGETWGAGNEVLGKNPAPLNGWHQKLLGWMAPDILDLESPSIQYTVEDFMLTNALSSRLYQLQGYDAKEYWLLENRNGTSYDNGIGASGMIIWHVNERMLQKDYWGLLYFDNSVNSGSLAVRIEEPGSITNGILSQRTNYSLMSYSFWENTITGFGLDSQPGTFYDNGSPALSGISFISPIAPNITFRFTNADFTEQEVMVFPNPFRPSKDISMVIAVNGGFKSISESGLKAWLTTSSGDLIKSFDSKDGSLRVNQENNNNSVFVTWNGIDHKGRQARPGIYYLRIEHDGRGAISARVFLDE